MARRPSKPRPMTQARKQAFIDALRVHGIIREAARQASPGSATGAVRSFYAEREADPEFRQAWDDAITESNASLEREAYRRAVEGYEEHRQHGGVTSVYRKYSDSILALMLRARVPGYNKTTVDAKVETVGEGEKAIADAVRRLVAESAESVGLAAELSDIGEAAIRGD